MIISNALADPPDTPKRNEMNKKKNEEEKIVLPMNQPL